MKKFSPETAAGASAPCLRSAVSQTCRIADFQIGNAPKLQRHLNYFRFTDLEIRDTADLEVGATEGRCADAPPTAVAAPLLGCSEANRNPFLCQKFLHIPDGVFAKMNNARCQNSVGPAGQDR